ncbi:response regulator [Spirosoma sp. HMF4905]|uniref:Response regulator n=1 Tax=Spirosoma arboris TaxID=2682092 RepID=A0A7K1SCY9_9BACT|nr:LytTR family DNA-binding domain-containing protein [Spirosoma arboris]MVM31641.1 response regulator [Spirosoma arboris]
MKKLLQPLVVEDTPVDAALLVDYLGQSHLCKEPLIATNLQEAFFLLNEQAVDVLFLDINVQGLSGLDFVNLLPKPLPVIVTSAHPEYAVDCYDLGINDFIQKPYTYQRLLRGIIRCIKPQSPIQEAKPKTQTDYIYLKVGRKSERFPISDILYIEAYGIYIKLISKTNMVVVNEQISEIEKRLPVHSFIRIHKSYIVNLLQITRIESRQIWVDKNKLPLGVTHRERVHDVLKELRIEQ